MRLDVVTLGASKLDSDSGAPLVQAVQPATDESDVESFGEVPLMQCLGVTSAPYPADGDGRYCEGVIASGIGGSDGVVIGARDTRTADIVGNLKPGDTIVHTTGPQQAAQLQLKEEKRQAVLVTKGTDGTQVLLVLDGKNDKVTLAAFGFVFNIDKTSASLVSPNGQNGLVVSDSGVHVMGKVILGGRTPNPAMSIMLGPLTGSPGGSTSAPMVAAPGVFIGVG